MNYHSVGELIADQATHSVTPNTSVQAASEIMAQHQFGALPVMDDGTLVGVFTERDLLNRVVAQKLSPQTTEVAQVMTTDPVTIKASDSLVKSLTLMISNQFRHLPVIWDDGRVGMLSSREVPAEYWVLMENWIAARGGIQGS